ncbi:hypothetical protein LF1_47610 [Rubripirellula obstinata]|uniref:Uncharacterized protein n=1 Tax=Rubripirellula obstinata TaxID=406547 RepID=A0A5B1CQS0_9BACT|nr:hypothetical protein LF1_47610 [Rubripirellula obstinata]
MPPQLGRSDRRTISGGKIGSESRQDFRFVELPKLLASFATPLFVPTVFSSFSRVGIAPRVVLDSNARGDAHAVKQILKCQPYST